MSPFQLRKPLDKLKEKIDDETEKIMSLSLITISDDLKKPASRANIGSIVFKDQSTCPFFAFIFNKSPEELSVTTSPSFEIAREKKFCDFIKDDIDRTS